MNTFQKVSLGFVAALVTALLMIGIEKITGWEIGLLIGWFPVTAWFTTWDFIKFKEGYPLRKTPFSKVLIAFGGALIICVVGTALHTHQIALGVICSLVYNASMYTNVEKEKN